MKQKCLFLFVFITTLSLLLASLSSKEQVEKVCADDYGTYIHPRAGITQLASSDTQQINGLPVLLFHFIFSSDSSDACLVAEVSADRYSSDTIPIYLSCRQILI